ncbi:MAG: hypothetical protein PHC88_12885 [Terrimicrobiaceae bacterium]|nr:hypothetical protein [Terrimicrobiaceae bacterium]
MIFRPSIRPAALALLSALCVCAALPDAGAQVRVDFSLRRSLFIRYEPLIATVTITNLSGRDLELADVDNHKWFSFNIVHVESGSEALVPPFNADYSLTPVQIPAGRSIKRAVNITPLYPLTEFGIYRVRATVFDSQSGHFFSSNPPLNVEITEGRMLWQQTVGVPEGEGGGGKTRTLTLLSHRLPDETQLYLRIEDKEGGLIYCTHQMGKLVSFSKPEVEIDANNQIHILQNTAPRMFLYSKVGLNGQILDRKEYTALSDTRPALRRDTAGGFQVVGGSYVDPNVIAAQKIAPPPPSVGDRPVPLPKSN